MLPRIRFICERAKYMTAFVSKDPAERVICVAECSRVEGVLR